MNTGYSNTLGGTIWQGRVPDFRLSGKAATLHIKILTCRVAIELIESNFTLCILQIGLDHQTPRVRGHIPKKGVFFLTNHQMCINSKARDAPQCNLEWHLTTQPFDGPANSDLVRENVNSLKGVESAYQVSASLEKVKLLAVQFDT